MGSALAQIADQRAGAQRVEPVQKELEFVGDNRLHAADFALALLAVGGDDLFEVVDIEEKDIVDSARLRVDVARHRYIDQEQRASAPLAHGGAQLVGAAAGIGGGGRGDADIDSRHLLG